jgi:hypothetical protein
MNLEEAEKMIFSDEEIERRAELDRCMFSWSDFFR